MPTRAARIRRLVVMTVLVAGLAGASVFGPTLALAEQNNAPTERTIALSTGTINLALAPGGQASESISVANPGNEPLKAFLYTSDVDYDEQGQPTYVRPTGIVDDPTRSPASWMSVHAPDPMRLIANTPYIELQPGEEMTIDFDVTVPPGVAPGDYNAIIFFEMFDEQDAEAGKQTRISGRIGARVVVRVAGNIVDRMDIAPFWVRSFVIGSVLPYSFSVVNQGNIDKRYVPTLVVLDGSEAERMRSVVETAAVVYAGEQREYVGGLGLRNASFGRFTLRVELADQSEPGAASGSPVTDVIRDDRTFWVLPLWFVIGAIFAAGLPLLWLSWRAASRKAERKARAHDQVQS